MILNLTNLEQSEIKYNIQKFPDNQCNVVVDFNWCKSPKGDSGNGSYNHPLADFSKEKIQIKSRLNNFKDLELIIATVASLKNLGVKEIHLYTPYFMGARSDRQFEKGGNNYLKQVICPIINSLNFDSVTVLDPHSNVLEACINNFKKIDNLNLVSSALEDLYVGKVNWQNKQSSNIKFNTDKVVFVSPDAGASHKIYKLAETIGYKGDIITCSKERDNEGNLTKTVVPLHGEHMMKDVIIIDDICDGGRTFINIVKEIQKTIDYYKSTLDYPMPKCYLIVTHGIFSAGFKELSQYFDGIYCTNSYSSIGDYAGNNMEKTLVKQFKVI